MPLVFALLWCISRCLQDDFFRHPSVLQHYNAKPNSAHLTKGMSQEESVGTGLATSNPNWSLIEDLEPIMKQNLKKTLHPAKTLNGADKT